MIHNNTIANNSISSDIISSERSSPNANDSKLFQEKYAEEYQDSSVKNKIGADPLPEYSGRDKFDSDLTNRINYLEEATTNDVVEETDEYLGNHEGAQLRYSIEDTDQGQQELRINIIRDIDADHSVSADATLINKVLEDVSQEIQYNAPMTLNHGVGLSVNDSLRADIAERSNENSDTSVAHKIPTTIKSVNGEVAGVVFNQDSIAYSTTENVGINIADIVVPVV